MAPSSYKEVCQAFERGKLSFDQVLEAFRALPLPDAPRKAQDLADVYRKAEEEPSDNSGFWISVIYDSLDLPDDAYEQMYRAAIDGK